MARSKQTWRGRATYERLLEERDREGLSFSELSERSGVPIGTLQRWGRRLSAERQARSPAFVEVVAAPAVASEDRIEVLLCSGRTLSLPPGPPFAGLAELVALLEAC